MPPSSSLGLTCETFRQPRARTIVPTSQLPVAKTPAFRLKVPKGFLPTFLFSALFLTMPLLNEYVTYDYSSTRVRVGVITAASLGALAIVVANDCVAWFNMVLFFHIGVEVTVLEKIMDYAQEDTSSDSAVVLAWVAFGIIIAHLFPFLLLDYEKTLTLCAFAGVIVNAATLVFVDSEKLLIASATSSSLLLSVLLIACIDCVQTSALSQLKSAMRGGLVRCMPYESTRMMRGLVQAASLVTIGGAVIACKHLYKHTPHEAVLAYAHILKHEAVMYHASQLAKAKVDAATLHDVLQMLDAACGVSEVRSLTSAHHITKLTSLVTHALERLLETCDKYSSDAAYCTYLNCKETSVPQIEQALENLLHNHILAA